LLEGIRGQREAERHRRARVRGDVVGARALRHEHADGRLRPRRRARRRGDDDPRALSLTAPVRRVVLYHAQGCHLCDVALEVVLEVQAAEPFELELVDIGGVPELEGAYRTRLPVVEIDGVDAFTYHVFHDALLERVRDDGSPGGPDV